MKKIFRWVKKLKNLRRRYKIIGIVLILVAGYFLFFSSKKTAPLQFSTVHRRTIQETISGSGTMTGKNSASLRFKSSGKLAYLQVSPGDTVYVGQAIAGLDTQELQIGLREAENTLRDKRAIVDKIHDDLKDVGAAETYAQRQTRTTAEVAQDNAYENLLSAQKALADSVLYSPIGGVVTQAPGIVGQTVSTSDVIAQVVDTSEVLFDTDIDESDIGKISIGQPAEITLDAYKDKVFKGLVDQVLPQTKTTSSGATVVTVRIKVENPPSPFVNGLSGEASIILHEVKNALVIPQEALREDNMVFVQKSGRVGPVKVTPGIASDVDVEIVSGLEENDRVLLNPPAVGSAVLGAQNRNPLLGVFRSLTGGNRGGGVRGSGGGGARFGQ